MHTLTGFRCDSKGMWVDVYTDASDCKGTPNTQVLNKWGNCQQTVDGAFFKVYVEAKPVIDDNKGKDKKDNKKEKNDQPDKQDQPDNGDDDDNDGSGAIAIKAASVALLALIGSQI